MAQITLRVDDELAGALKAAAQASQRSVNRFVTGVLRAALDPDLAGDEAQRVRERLARAGLLAEGGPTRRRPDTTAVARARRAAGRGTALSDLVVGDRR
jgi:predicted transcriptional regulator